MWILLYMLLLNLEWWNNFMQLVISQDLETKYCWQSINLELEFRVLILTMSCPTFAPKMSRTKNMY